MNIKRYDFGTEYRGSIGTPAIVEQTDGQYVKYDDYKELLDKMEAIRRTFYSGMRVSQIIRAEHINSAFVLHDSKNDDPRIVPIHPKIYCTLKVPMKDRYWTSKRFKEAARSVGLGDMTFHDLRHSAASAMIGEGVDLHTVGAVLGHRSPVSTKCYPHLATDALREALGRIGKKSPKAKNKKVA